MPATNIDDVTVTFDERDGNSSHFSSHDQNSGNAAKASNISSQVPVGKKDGKPYIIPRSSTSQNKPGISGSTPSDSKKNRTDVREQPSKNSGKETLDDQFQKMFLETLPHINNRNSTASVSSSSSSSHYQPYPPPMMEKSKNGYNSNNSVTSNTPVNPSSSVSSSRSSFKGNQLHRYVEPPSAPAISSDGEKQKCCVIS